MTTYSAIVDSYSGSGDEAGDGSETGTILLAMKAEQSGLINSVPLEGALGVALCDLNDALEAEEDASEARAAVLEAWAAVEDDLRHFATWTGRAWVRKD